MEEDDEEEEEEEEATDALAELPVLDEVAGVAWADLELLAAEPSPAMCLAVSSLIPYSRDRCSTSMLGAGTEWGKDDDQILAGATGDTGSGKGRLCEAREEAEWARLLLALPSLLLLLLLLLPFSLLWLGRGVLEPWLLLLLLPDG